MDKKLQDRVWSVLPKEFKEEVKKLYQEYRFTRAGYYEELFGRHNLTSDAEGEEMLYVSRKEIQQLVAANDKLIKKHPGRDSIEANSGKNGKHYSQPSFRLQVPAR